MEMFDTYCKKTVELECGWRISEAPKARVCGAIEGRLVERAGRG